MTTNCLNQPPVARAIIGMFAALTCLTVVGTAQVPQAQSGSTLRLTLTALLDSVSRRFPLSLAADARARAARSAQQTAGALGNPVLSYDVEHASSASGIQGPSVLERESMSTAMLPLESFYTQPARARAAEALTRAAESDAVAQRRHLGLDAAEAFYRMALAQVAVATARDLTAWLDSVVAYNRRRFEEGAAAEAELMRSELERDRAITELASREADFAKARARLAPYVGAYQQTVFALVPGETMLSLPAAFPAGSRTPGQPNARRPELRAAQDRLIAANASVSKERLMLVRQLDLTIGTKREAGMSSLITGLSLPLPLFDRNQGEVGRARAERDIAAYELAAVSRTVQAEISGAQTAAAILTDRLTTLSTPGRRSVLERADEVRRLALGAYREGASSLLEVLDAARTWGETRVAWYGVLFAQHMSVLELRVAQGDDLFEVAQSLERPSSEEARIK